MSDEQQRRSAPVTAPERKSPGDRARQIQELLQRGQPAPAQPGQPPASAHSGRPAAQVMGPNLARVAEAQKVAEKLGPGRTTATEQTAYAKMQADATALFGGGTPFEVTGNPWKVIDFSAYLPMVFTPSKPASEYLPQVPEQAVRTEQGLIFEATLHAKDDAEPPQKRAVLVDGGGALLGAECRSAPELQRLLQASPQVAQRVFSSAFEGAAPKDAKLREVSAAPGGAFEVSVEASGEVKSVGVNNFAQAGRPNLAVQDYWSDRFEASR